MDSSDFADAFYINSDGRTLSYVTFELPSATYGRFYYNYTSPSKFDYTVTADRKLYVYSSPYLSNVSFVPAEGYTGTFAVTYTGYTSAGTSFSGKIKITVTGAQSDSITYETNSMTPAAFRAADFVTAFMGKTSSPLYYVRFTLPYESYGTLYYGGSTRVQAASSYYVNYSPNISDIRFVPNPTFSGILAVSYTL
jgi:hypothetical protein